MLAYEYYLDLLYKPKPEYVKDQKATVFGSIHVFRNSKN